MHKNHKRKEFDNIDSVQEEIICNRLIKKLKEELIQITFNKSTTKNNEKTLKPFYKILQNKLEQEIYKENSELNRELTITKLPFEILLNILQFFEIYDSLNLNYYLVCKDWFYTIYNNEHFWTLQFTKFWNTLQKYNNKIENFTIDVKNNIFYDWKHKRKYLLLKNKLTLQQIQLKKQKKAIYNNILLNHEEHIYKIEENPSFLETDPIKLLFTKNILFTKFNVNLQRRIEDDSGGSESKGQLRGYYFLNNYPNYLKFNFKFKTNYDVNLDDEFVIWNYQLTFTKEDLQENDKIKVTKVDALKKSYGKRRDVVFYLTRDVLEKLNEWLDLKDETKVYPWLVDTFFKKELSFLGYGVSN